MVVFPFFLNPIYDYTISFFNDNSKKFLYDYNHEDYVKNNYPLLSKYEWSNAYFKELYSLPEPSYKDYVGWKYDEYIGDTINISQKGIRKTVNDKLINNDQYLFFGGSAIWGFGVSDQFTIPSIFSKMSSMTATNYAEPGYIVRQSLSALTNLYIRSANFLLTTRGGMPLALPAALNRGNNKILPLPRTKLKYFLVFELLK